MLILSVAAPRTGSTRFGQLLQSMNAVFLREPFHPTAYLHCARGPSGLRFYDKAPYSLSDFGRDMAADSVIKGLLPSRPFRMRAVPRHTASYLQELSNSLKQKESLKAAQFISDLLEKASAAIGPAYNLFREPRVAKRICELLDAMEGTYTLELFPNHLTRECHGFLCRTYPFIVHQRTLIDSYVSLIKTDFRRWSGVNTTGHKVRICPESFVAYCRSISDYYLRSLRLGADPRQRHSAPSQASQPRHCVINYEDWSDHPNHEQSGRVYQLLEQKGFSNVFQEPEPSAVKPSEAMTRQDRASDWSDKVTNAQELIQILTQQSLQGLLGARPLEIPALGVPLHQ